MRKEGLGTDGFTAEDGLFKRLPESLFAPLAAPSRDHYWRLLLQLYDRYFGPDAEQPAEGYDHRTITAEIDRFMLSNRDWVAEDGQPFATEVGVRANLTLAQLRQWGWMRDDKVGIRSNLVMPTNVVGFMGLLKSFAEEGPQVIGGQVQSIHNSLLQVRKNPSEQAAAFHQAAREAVRLISGLNATGVRVREVMDRIGAEGGTRDFVVGFFQHYISELYIRDYQEMRTQNHPLKHRHDILNLVFEISEDMASRDALKAYYGRVYRLNADSDREEYLRRDLDRLSRFHDIQRYLDRLDDAVQRGASQALTKIAYSLRIQGRLDRLIEDAARVTVAGGADARGVALPLGGGGMFSSELLREYKTAKPIPKRTATRKVPMTDRQRALQMLWKARDLARTVTARQVESYLMPLLKQGAPMSSDDLPIVSIGDLCVFTALRREAASRRPRTARRGAGSDAVRSLKWLTVIPLEGEFTDNDYMLTGRFRVERVGKN